MTNQRPALYSVLQSRKMWATLIGIVTTIVTAIVNKQAIDPDTLINAIMILVSVYVSAVAIEDGLTARAASNATTTTVSTPGSADVKITPPETPVVISPAQPFVDRTGLR